MSSKANERQDENVILKMPNRCVQYRGCRNVKQFKVYKGRKRSKQFSIDKDGVYFFGTKYAFEPSSFKAFETKDCGLHTESYVVDKRDVYTAHAQSCGPSSCDGPDYHGYYWWPIGVKHPESFVWLGAGYGRDLDRIIYLWHPGMQSEADARTFDVFLCGGEKGQIVAKDKSHYFIDGQVVDPKIIFEKWSQ